MLHGLVVIWNSFVVRFSLLSSTVAGLFQGFSGTYSVQSLFHPQGVGIWGNSLHIDAAYSNMGLILDW